ncbi:unnamed protein product [Agarophyton chilense]
MLQQFASCSALANYYRDNALARVGPYGLNRGNTFLETVEDPNSFPSWCLYGGSGVGVIGGNGGLLGSFGNGGSGGAGGNGGSGTVSGDFSGGNGGSGAVSGGFSGGQQSAEPVPGADFSETNNQVEGVDEPDIIKTNGNQVYIVRGDTLTVLTVLFGGRYAQEAGTLKLPQTASEMLIDGDHLLIIARGFSSYPGGFGGPGFIPFGSSETFVYQVKIRGNQPTLLATLRMEGRYVNSREVDGTARIVLSYQPALKFQFTSPSCSLTFGGATEHNKNLIRNSTEADWYPRFHLKVESDGTESSGSVSSCNNVYHTPSFSGFELLTVVSISVSGNLIPAGGVSISSEGRTVYSTATQMYVTTTEYKWNVFGSLISSGSDFKTSIHKFSMSNSGVQYVASGEVSGSVLNQFSMHDYQGFFYIATTDGAPWWGSRDLSASKVTCFDTNLNTRKLIKTGEVGALGIGERIYSVRYIENTAYVVTFRQVDPLYIVDLSNPRALKVTGELKIPGFSSYLHPIAPGRILGVGQDATLVGRRTGAKVTLFDVQDKSNPKELSSWTLQGSSSSVDWDHRAFLYWKPEGIAILPVSTYFSSTHFVGSVVLEVSDDEIKERGRITHQSANGNSNFHSTSIERNIVIGGDHIWSLSYQQIQINNMKDLNVESNTRLKRNTADFSFGFGGAIA